MFGKKVKLNEANKFILDEASYRTKFSKSELANFLITVGIESLISIRTNDEENYTKHMQMQLAQNEDAKEIAVCLELMEKETMETLQQAEQEQDVTSN